MKRLLSIFILTACIFTSTCACTSANAASIPRLQMVTQPKVEYKDGDRISFTVTSPNYSGKVEYRVILWNGTTKKTSELWKTYSTGYYYKKWQPAGNYKFNINWPVSGMESGAYSLTVLVRRVGAKVSYDSYVKTNAFWVKTIGSNFIGNGTEKRVPIIRIAYTLPWDLNSKKFYYAGNTYMDERISPNPKFPNHTINDNIIDVSNKDQLYNISYSGKDYTIFMGDTIAANGYDSHINMLKKSGVFDGNKHNFEVYLYEVFYDKNKKSYYVANEKHAEIMDATVELLQHKKGDIPKYLAIPVQIADF